MHNIEQKEILSQLLEHINLCLHAYRSEELVRERHGEDKSEAKYRRSWSPMRILQNHLHLFLDESGCDQCIAIATLLIYMIEKEFSDLCMGAPWDNLGIIDLAREASLDSLLEFLKSINSSLENSDEKTDEQLWQAFRKFEEEYNKILMEVNQKDSVAIKNLAID